MSRIRDLPGAAWVAIGLAAGNVGIIGSNGNAAFGGVSAEAHLLGLYVNPKAIHVNTPHAVIGKAAAQR